MQRIVPITFAVALLAAVVPLGAATWSSQGDSEPSTTYDDPTMMWQDPSTSGKKVYLNGYGVEYLVGPNPNVAALQTRNEVPGIETLYAMLGVWVDCNGDGYVGAAEGALREYDAALLDLMGVNHCPPSMGDADEWDGSHNYNGWVTELVPIGNGDVDTEFDKRQYEDEDVMIWADFGRPEEPSTTAGGSCPVNPQPRGTWQSTGGLINYLDCSTGLMSRMNLASAESYQLAGEEVPGPGDPLGIRFDDTDDARGHPVWDHPTLGSEDRSRSAVYTRDCDVEPLFYSGDTLNDTAPGSYETLSPVPLNWSTVYNVTVYQPPSSPVTSDPTGATVPGTVNETDNDCEYDDDTEGSFYGALEGEEAPVRLVGKDQAGFNFEYLGVSSRGHDVREDFNDDGEREVDVASPYHNGTAGADFFGGQGVSSYLKGEWWGGTNLIKGPPQTVATRVDVENGTADPGPDEAWWLSFYAFVGTNSTGKGMTLPGGTGVYGQAQCGGAEDGILNGWDCDRSHWNIDTEGQPITSTHRLAVVGDAYNLRDVDCQDGGNALGIGLGLPFYGEEACATFG